MNYKLVPPAIEYDSEKCVGCGLCERVCPHRLFQVSHGKAVLRDEALCMECGACSSNCPVGAIQVQAGVGCATAIVNGMLNRKGNLNSNNSKSK